MSSGMDDEQFDQLVGNCLEALAAWRLALALETAELPKVDRAGLR